MAHEHHGVMADRRGIIPRLAVGAKTPLGARVKRGEAKERKQGEMQRNQTHVV